MKALIVIDMQKGLMKKDIINKETLIETINNAINIFAIEKQLVIFFQHKNKILAENTIEWELDEHLHLDKNIVFQKIHGNTFQETNLDKYLKDNKVNEIIVCGLVTHGCVKATCLGGKEKGYKVKILRNGHSSWNKDAKQKIEITEKELQETGILPEEI